MIEATLRRHPSLTGWFTMQFDTKIAVVIRTDLEAWQKLNVAAFLTSGIAAAFPECIGEPYSDGSGTRYLSLIGQPILIYGADRAALTRALERALARNVTPAIYTEDMFKTTHDAAGVYAPAGLTAPRRACGNPACVPAATGGHRASPGPSRDRRLDFFDGRLVELRAPSGFRLSGEASLNYKPDGSIGAAAVRINRFRRPSARSSFMRR
jgi:hypothetical protein